MERSTEVGFSNADAARAAPLVSITLLNYNYGRYLPDCIGSILSQTLQDFELIVIDDKSSDNSLEVIRPFLADPRVRLVAHEQNTGYRNSLIEGTEAQSRGEFLMVISADDVVRSNDALERQVRAMRMHPSAAFCFSAYDRFDGETGAILERVQSYQRDTVIKGEEFFRNYITDQRVQVLHSGTMIRRSAYQSAGGYRRDLTIALDLSMWLMLSLEGDVAYCNDFLYAYRSHSQQMSQSPAKVRLNALECESAVEVACARAREKRLKVHEIRDQALQYILLAIAIDDAFSKRTRLAMSRVRSALVLQPRLTLTSKGFWVVAGRLLLGEQLYGRTKGLFARASAAPQLRQDISPPRMCTSSGGPLRVVLISNSVMMGGTEEHVRRLASGLRDRGVDVSVVVPETPLVDRLAHALESKSIPVKRLTLAYKTEGIGTLTRAARLIRWLRLVRPQVVHIHLIGYTGGRWAAWAARLAGVPTVVCTMHIAPTKAPSLNARANRAVQSWFVDRFVAVSEDNSRSLAAAFGIPPDKLSVIPNSVSLSEFSGDREPDRTRLRAEFGIPQKAWVIGALARLDPQKGLTFLVQALPLVHARHPCVHALIVGDGELRTELEAKARQLGVAQYVHFAGYRNDAASVLKAIDIAALPSLQEGLPLSLLEAMASGLPIVATRVGGMPDVIRDRVFGRLVPPQDPAALADAISEMLADPEALAAMGAAARSSAAEYSEEALLDRVLALYADASVGKVARLGAVIA